MCRSSATWPPQLCPTCHATRPSKRLPRVISGPGTDDSSAVAMSDRHIMLDIIFGLMEQQLEQGFCLTVNVLMGLRLQGVHSTHVHSSPYNCFSFQFQPCETLMTPSVWKQEFSKMCVLEWHELLVNYSLTFKRNAIRSRKNCMRKFFRGLRSWQILEVTIS